MRKRRSRGLRRRIKGAIRRSRRARRARRRIKGYTVSRGGIRL